MNDSTDTTYLDLLVSLPELKSPFVSRQLPISRWQLEKRLGQLSPPHRQVLETVCSGVNHRVLKAAFDPLTPVVDDGLPASDLSLAGWCDQWDLQQLYPCLQSQLDRCCLLAALRRRVAGEPPPPADVCSGLSNCARQVVRQWSQPHFQLQHRFTWLPAVRNLLERGDTAGLERLLVQLAWEDYSRCWELCCRVGYEHNLVAVIVYVLRWQLVDAWLAQSAEHSAREFDNAVAKLIDTALPQNAAAVPDFINSVTSGDTQ